LNHYKNEFKIFCEVLPNINCDAFNELLLNNIQLIINYYPILIDLHFDFTKNQNEILEKLCKEKLKGSILPLIKLLVLNGAQLQNKNKKIRSKDNAKVISFLIQKNIIIPY
jgi:hypothetical protein